MSKQSSVNSGQLPVISEQYASGAASLFAAAARNVKIVYPEPPKSPPTFGLVIISCPWCLSDKTEMVDHDQQIYRCRNCGELFERPPG